MFYAATPVGAITCIGVCDLFPAIVISFFLIRKDLPVPAVPMTIILKTATGFPVSTSL